LQPYVDRPWNISSHGKMLEIVMPPKSLFIKHSGGTKKKTDRLKNDDV
jgi:hypothetical protein